MKFSLIPMLLVTGVCFSSNSRILKTRYDLSKPITINMAAGRATSITLPCKIADVFSGVSGGISKSFSKSDPRRMALRIDNFGETNTNLILHCAGSDDVILLDVKNAKPHQDVLIISGTYGSPNSGFRKVPAKKRQKNRILETSYVR